MTVVGQLRSQGQRWFGGSISELAVDTGSTPTRRVHPEEATVYAFKVTAGGVNLKLLMPYDVRNWTTGVVFRDVYVDAASTRSVALADNAGTVFATVPAGQTAIVFLTSVATAIGAWRAVVRTAGGKAVHA